jgi:hypothetical protein
MTDQRHPPNPVEKAAESSALPRELRARVGQTTDPVPEGKEVAADPVHHFNAKDAPESHDQARSHPKDPSELGLTEQDAAKLTTQRGEDLKARQHLPNRNDVQIGMDWRGTATQANKLMDSRHRGADFGGQRSAMEDSTRRSQPKGKK